MSVVTDALSGSRVVASSTCTWGPPPGPKATTGSGTPSRLKSAVVGFTPPRKLGSATRREDRRKRNIADGRLRIERVEQSAVQRGSRFRLCVRAGRWRIGGGASPLHENLRRVDRRRIDLRPECAANRADVRASLQPVVTDDGLMCVGAAGHHVRAAHGLLERRHHPSIRVARGQARCLLAVPRCDADLSEIADARKRREVRLPLHARAEDCKHRRVLACEGAGRHRRRPARADRRDIGAVHDGERGAVVFVEQGDESLVRRQTVVVIARKNRDQLHLQRDSGHVPGHRAHDPQLGHANADPRRDDGDPC